jgi:hypothetical protein
MDYQKLVTFHSFGRGWTPVYHTNVVMTIGTSVAVVCFESIRDAKERQHLFVRSVPALMQPQYDFFLGVGFLSCHDCCLFGGVPQTVTNSPVYLTNLMMIVSFIIAHCRSVWRPGLYIANFDYRDSRLICNIFGGQSPFFR